MSDVRCQSEEIGCLGRGYGKLRASLAISDPKLGWVPAEKGPREFAGLGW